LKLTAMPRTEATLHSRYAYNSLHHRRGLFCIKPGEMDVGGLDKVTPVLGLTIGMPLRTRTADGCG
jgi:hypothetical protein